MLQVLLRTEIRTESKEYIIEKKKTIQDGKFELCVRSFL